MTHATVFFCEPTGEVRRSLRRYVRHDDHPCIGEGYSYHHAMTFLDVVRADGEADVSGDRWPHDDPRWPTACERCRRAFTDSDEFQLFTETLYRRIDTGEVAIWPDMPVGACRDLEWLHDRPNWCGPDGRSLEVKTPGGRNWMIDSRARNCTLPDDTAHRCWVRHGKPEDGTLHVDKNGLTCAAGAGSIDTGVWHGFLHNGVLSEGG